MQQLTENRQLAKAIKDAVRSSRQTRREQLSRATASVLTVVMLLLCAAALPLMACSQAVNGRALPTTQTSKAEATTTTATTVADELLEVGTAERISAAAVEPTAITVAPAELKIISYNMRWRGGSDLRKLIKLLGGGGGDEQIGGAHIIGLQEVDRGKKRTDNSNTARLMAEELGMHYAWAAPPRAKPSEKEDETGVALLSPYPLRDVVRLVLPHEGPNKRRRAAIGATVQIGKIEVRAYSVHAETRIPNAKKMEQLGAVLEDLRLRPHVRHVVVLGDFNTIKGKDVRGARRLFDAAGFATPFPDNRPTWHTFIIKLKLDWIWLRGLEPTAHGIAHHVKFSDHWPLWTKVKFSERPGG